MKNSSARSCFQPLSPLPVPPARGAEVPAQSGVAAVANILGSGTFGQVVRREIDGQHVAVKMFHAATRDNALQEVAASAAMGAHPCVIQLLDALVVGNQVHLVYPLWDQTLSQLLAQRKACPPGTRFAGGVHSHIILPAGRRSAHAHSRLDPHGYQASKCACERWRVDR